MWRNSPLGGERTPSRENGQRPDPASSAAGAATPRPQPAGGPSTARPDHQQPASPASPQSRVASPEGPPPQIHGSLPSGRISTSPLPQFPAEGSSLTTCIAILRKIISRLDDKSYFPSFERLLLFGSSPKIDERKSQVWTKATSHASSQLQCGRWIEPEGKIHLGKGYGCPRRSNWWWGILPKRAATRATS